LLVSLRRILYKPLGWLSSHAPAGSILKTMERSEYIEQRNGGYYVAATRVSLDSIVYSFKSGDPPEPIRQNFSSLTLEQVYDYTSRCRFG
jgi:uncharacterized protein (DUF433 family)